MKKTILYVSALLILSCASIKPSGKELLQNNKDVQIAKFLTIVNNDSLYINELRLYLPSALGTQKYMFKKFGHWDKVIRISDYQEYLIWENCKLFDGKVEFYTVAASGIENIEEMYSSVIIQNKENIDLLSENSQLKDTLVSMFYYGTKKTTLSKDKFYKKYWKMRDSIK